MVTVTAADPEGLEASQSFQVTVPNSAPEPARRLPDIVLVRGSGRSVDAVPYFIDPDGDALTFRAASSDPAVATAATSGNAVAVRALARGTVTITVTAADPAGLEASLSFEVTVPNSGPRAAEPMPALEVPRGTSATVDVSRHFTDPDGDPLTVAAGSSNPSSVAADASGGAVTVRALARGSATITVTVADPAGLEWSQSFDVTVPNSGPEPIAEMPDIEMPAGETAKVDVSSHFRDPDGDALTYRAESSNPAVAVTEFSPDAAGDTLAVRSLARGTATVTVTAADTHGLEATLTFDVTVPNSGPRGVGELPDVRLVRGAERSVDVSAHFTDPDADSLTYRAGSSDPAVAVADAATSAGEVTVRALARGTATITVTATDPVGSEASLDFDVTVPNSPPRGSGEIADITVRRGAEATVDVSPYFTDPDGDALTYRAETSDSTVAEADHAGSVLTVRGLALGTATITVTAADPVGSEASLDFDVTVANSPPRGSGEIADITVRRGAEATVEVSPYFTDPDGDALTYRAETSDSTVAEANHAGSVLTVRGLALGTATITVTAADPVGSEASLDFDVTVANGAPAPVGTMPDLGLGSGERKSVDASPWFHDPDADPLEYAAESSRPEVATAQASDSLVMLRAVRRGTTKITVTATDPSGLSASQSFEVAVANGGPGFVTALPDVNLVEGEEVEIAVSPFFFDPDDDPLAFGLASTDTAVVAPLELRADTVVIRGEAVGTAHVIVTATDPDGAEAAQSFEVSVRARPPPPPSRPGYDIRLGFHSSISPSVRSVIEGARTAWESILADTDLPDVVFNGPVRCGGLVTTQSIGTVDDLLIFFLAGSIDGPGGTLGFAGPCQVRAGSLMPIVGRVVLDLDDIDRLSTLGGLYDVVMHEMAHVLGFGILWDLEHPSSATDPVPVDTHFPGPRAVAAFDAAGGSGYTGGKVPVENEISGRNGHWRYSIFAGELMAPRISASGGSALSAITIRALEDLGYRVGTSLADPYTVAIPDAPPGPPVADLGPFIELGDDLLRVPIQIVDGDGRVTRVIPPR